MIIGILVMGIILTVFGLINIFLKWCCDDMVAMSYLSFFGGILFILAGWFLTIPESAIGW